MQANELIGVDIQESRITKRACPFSGLDLRLADINNLDFKDASFEFVSESTMFVQVTNDDLAEKFAADMNRVTNKRLFVTSGLDNTFSLGY